MDTILPHLQCPYCASNLNLKSKNIIRDKRGNLLYGIVSCNCDVYPVTAGILYIKKALDCANQEACKLISQERYIEASARLMETRKIPRYIYKLLVLYQLNTGKIPFGFKTTLKLLLWTGGIKKPWYDYLIGRPDRISFRMSLSTLSAISDRDTVCDIGCGVAYFLNTMHQISPARISIGMDISFTLLLLSRLFIPKNNFYICADLGHGTPFKPGTLDIVYLNDIYMNIFNKKRAFGDLATVLKDNGRLFINHIHNRGQNNLGQCYAASPVEVADDSRPFNILTITDTDMWKQIKNLKRITYSAIKQPGKYHDTKAYFVYAAKKSLRSINFNLSAELQTHILKKGIVYTEDEHLN